MKNQVLKNNTFKVSIVMATYNGEKFLEKQLNTILEQSYLADEIIILDDNSSDHTCTILHKYQKIFESHNIACKFILREENVGYIQNFIDGIKESSSDIIILSDQDDEWMNNKIEFILSFFNKYNDCVALHTNTNIIDVDGNILKINAQEYIKEVDKVELKSFLKRINYAGMALAFNKNKILPGLIALEKENIMFPTHDWVICFLAVLENGFYTSSIVLTYRRYTGNNVALTLSNSRISSLSRRIEGIKLYMKHYSFVSDSISIHNIDISSYILTAKNRIEYLNKSSFLLWFKNMKMFSFYPSIKSYLADLILLIKDKNDRK